MAPLLAGGAAVVIFWLIYLITEIWLDSRAATGEEIREAYRATGPRGPRAGNGGNGGNT